MSSTKTDDQLLRDFDPTPDSVVSSLLSTEDKTLAFPHRRQVTRSVGLIEVQESQCHCNTDAIDPINNNKAFWDAITETSPASIRVTSVHAIHKIVSTRRAQP